MNPKVRNQPELTNFQMWQLEKYGTVAAPRSIDEEARWSEYHQMISARWYEREEYESRAAQMEADERWCEQQAEQQMFEREY